jgi:hypothetical protein
MHTKSLLHVRDHSKATGPAHHMIEYIAQHVNAYTGEAFELTVDRIAHRLQVSSQWVGQLRRQLIETGELLVKQSRGRRPNVYIIPYERCPACQHANPQVAAEGDDLNDDLNPKVEFGVEDPNSQATPKQPPSNPKVDDGASPLLPGVKPQKGSKVSKEILFSQDGSQPQSPRQPPTKKPEAQDQTRIQAKPRTAAPIGEARRQFIAELTAWAQEGAPDVDAPRFLDLWLYQCEAHHYAWRDWHAMAKWKLREASYARQGCQEVAPAGAPAQRVEPACGRHGCHQPQCPHTQFCRGHACCAACAEESRAAGLVTGEAEPPDR